MSTRATRLLQLLDRLRQARSAVTGEQLAQELDISLRTLYRDIATLRLQGAHIEGDPGIGYQMRGGFMLPPLMFDQDELEALVLGARWVESQADAELAQAACRALARISSVLPEVVRTRVDTTGLYVPIWQENKTPEPWLPVLRHAIRNEHKLRLDYVDAKGDASERMIWPFAMAFFDPSIRLIYAWCELRQDFRHFRADRVIALHDTGENYPVRRHQLMKRWQALHATEPSPCESMSKPSSTTF